MTSFRKNLLCVILAITAGFGTVVKATPSPGEDFLAEEECIPALSVSDNAVDNTILIRVAEGNTCPISHKIILVLRDGVPVVRRPDPLRLPGSLSNQQGVWVVPLNGVEPGPYRVMGINFMPDGIGDKRFIDSGNLGIDQVITVGGTRLPPTQQIHPVAPPPPVEVAPTRQVVTTLDPDSKQLLRNFDQWMRWFQVNIWPQLQPLIRAIEGIKTS